VTTTQSLEKRLFDIVVSLAGIAVLFIPFVFIAILVKLTSKGPVFFRQQRVGQKGGLFVCIKFRTMYANSEIQGSITTAADSRITPMGRFLRRFKLDELPQLWNVLTGKMSFVGPRPDVPGYADQLKGEDRRILSLRPGITGPASLCFRNEEQRLAKAADPKVLNDKIIWPYKVALNRKYLKDWSFFKDIGYILVTLCPFLDLALHLIPAFPKEVEMLSC
jgi:lipopolysaccharide/colanic/teichoic acid biosynthesis glycosyltransferase